ncbi:MAG: hypothetical protein RMM53_10475, partial [Bacteroidia bacterium]|nr:hypothetical protein [Bacteroidia bacterium]
IALSDELASALNSIFPQNTEEALIADVPGALFRRHESRIPVTYVSDLLTLQTSPRAFFRRTNDVCEFKNFLTPRLSIGHRHSDDARELTLTQYAKYQDLAAEAKVVNFGFGASFLVLGAYGAQLAFSTPSVFSDCLFRADLSKVFCSKEPGNACTGADAPYIPDLASFKIETNPDGTFSLAVYFTKKIGDTTSLFRGTVPLKDVVNISLNQNQPVTG